MEKIGMEVPVQGQLKSRLQFIEENSCHLRDIAAGLEEVLERLVGPEPQCCGEEKVAKSPEGIFEELEYLRDRYSVLIGRLGVVTERLQQAI